MAYSCVRVQFEIGHEASIRNKRTPEGFTHDWEVFVRGVDNADIHHFIDKVVFLLHDTFPKPKRIVKEPPYCVKESGYAGFNLPIDIYFKGKDEQRKARFYYDLTLQNSGPRISKVIREKADFPNPSEDFRRKLIKGGGVGIGSDGANSSIDKNTNNNNVNASEEKKSSPLTSKPKVSSSSDPAKKHKTKDKELMKQDELKTSNYFAELFGTPIKTVKHSPTNSKPLQVKPLQSDKPIHEKQIKETSKSSKHSPHKEKEREGKESLKKEKEADRSSSKEKERSKEKDKESHREKEKNKEKFAKKPSSPVPVRTLKEEVLKKVPDENKEKINSKVEGLKVEKKHKEKKRDDKERKHHDKKEVDKEKNYDKSEKKVDPSKENKDSQKSKTPLSKDEKKPKTVEKDKERTSDVEKQRHKHKKKDKHKDEEKERQKKKDNDKLPVEVPKVKPKSPSPPPPTPPALQTLPQHTPQINPKSAIRPLNRLLEELPDKDSDSDLSITNEEDGKCEPPPEPALIIKSKVEEKKFDPKEEKVRKKDKKLKEDDKESRKRKRKMKNKEEPTEKAFKVDLKEEGRSDKSPAVSKNDDSRSPSPQTVFTEDYVTQLKDLQHKIMTLQDNADLQRVVQVISETGQFEITPRTFDFDLCALDPSTVKRLQDMFIAAS